MFSLMIIGFILWIVGIVGFSLLLIIASIKVSRASLSPKKLAGSFVLFFFLIFIPSFTIIYRRFLSPEPSVVSVPQEQSVQKQICTLTAQDIQGPYYRPNAPARDSLAPPDVKSERLIISGTVYKSDCQTPLANAVIDIWHADSEGNYDNDSPNYWYRGIIPVDSQGRYQFQTVRPGNYLDGGGFRPAHIHFKVTIPGYRPLTTQLYFKDDPYLGPKDSCISCNSEDPTLTVDLTKKVEDGSGGPVWFGTFNIILKPVEPQGLDTTDTTDWQTYRNAKYGFEVRYPKEFEVHVGGSTKDSPDRLNFRAIDVCNKDWGWPGHYSYTPGLTVGKNYSRNERVIAGHRAIIHSYYDYEYEIKKDNCVSLLFTLSSRSPGDATEPTAEQKEIFDKILATFRFAEENEVALWTDCVDDPEGIGIPVITSISPDSGPVGTELEIRGCNFNGFEGDLHARIENNQGVNGAFSGNEGSTSKFIKITLRSPLCQGDDSYSGRLCEEWLTLTPGTYKIYVTPWGHKSNEVNFTIIQ